MKQTLLLLIVAFMGCKEKPKPLEIITIEAVDNGVKITGDTNLAGKGTPICVSHSAPKNPLVPKLKKMALKAFENGYFLGYKRAQENTVALMRGKEPADHWLEDSLKFAKLIDDVKYE